MRRGWILLILIFFSFLVANAGHPQPASRDPSTLKLGEITFKLREVGSPPTSLKLIELSIEVWNRSRGTTVPANSVKVVVSPKTIVYADQKPLEEFSFPPQEGILSLPLPPMSGRVLIFGFSLPKEKIESIAFEVELNPPEGEKRTVTCSSLTGR